MSLTEEEVKQIATKILSSPTFADNLAKAIWNGYSAYKGQSSKRASQSYEKECNRCNAKIKMVKGEDGKWQPLNMDGTSHRCNK